MCKSYFVLLFVLQSVCSMIDLSINLSVKCLYISPSNHSSKTSDCQSSQQSLRLTVHLTLSLSISLCVCLSISPSTCSFIRSCVCMSVCRNIKLLYAYILTGGCDFTRDYQRQFFYVTCCYFINYAIIISSAI